MPWWENQPQQDYNQAQYQQFMQSWQQQWAQRQQQQDAANQKHDGSLLGDFFGGLADAGGSMLTKGITGLSTGMDWWDSNVVKNVWDYGMGPATAGAMGRQWDDSWKYDNMDGAQKLAAGMAADPLNWIPAAGVGTKALKVAAAGSRFEKAAAAAELGVRALDKGMALPFEGAAKGIGLTARGAKFGVTRSLGSTELGTDILRTLGRPTKSWLQSSTGNKVWAASESFAHEIAQRNGLQGPESITGMQFSDEYKQAMDKTRRWYEGMSHADTIIDPEEADMVRMGLQAPTPAERALYDLTSAGSDKYHRELTKRLWENFRRTATGAPRATGANDLDYADQVIRGLKTKQYDRNTALALLTDNAGNRDLADQILLGAVDPADERVKLLGDWLDRSSTGLGRNWSLGEGQADLMNAQDVIGSLRKSVENQIGQDIDSATKAARVYMDQVHFGPLPLATGKYATAFDPVYNKYWKGVFDKHILSPWSRLTLGSFGFPIGNAGEEVMQSMIGGVGVNRIHGMNFDEFMSIAGQLPPEMTIHPSLTEGAQGAMAAAAGADSRMTLAFQGSETPDKAKSWFWRWSDWTMGKSNQWSGNLRRNYMIRRYNQYLQDSFPGLSQILKDAEKDLGTRAYSDKLQTYLNSGLAMYGAGKTPEEVAGFIAKNMSSRDYNVEKLLQFVDSADLHPRATYFLKRNAQGLADPAQRDNILKQAANLYMQDVSLASSAMPEQISKWGDGILANIDAASPDELLKMYQQIDDASRVFGHLHANRAEFSARTRILSGSTESEHLANIGQPEAIEQAYSDFTQKAANAIRRANDRLVKAGVLTEEGAAQLQELPKLYQQRYEMNARRQTQINQVRKEFLGEKGRMADLTPDKLSELSAREAGVHDSWRAKLEDIDKQIRAKSQLRDTHLKAGVKERNAQYHAEEVVKAAKVPAEEQEDAARAVKQAIMAGEDPLDALASPEWRRFNNAPEGSWRFTYPQLPPGPEPTGFSTAKGSTYELHGDQTTTRNKAARPEHPGDSGPKDKSQRTVYVGEVSTTDDVNRILRTGEFSNTPQVGLHPLEVWDDGKKFHYGNEITELHYGRASQGDLASIPEAVHPTIAAETMSAPELAYNAGKDPEYAKIYHSQREGARQRLLVNQTLDDPAIKEQLRKKTGLNIQSLKEWQRLPEEDQALYVKAIENLRGQAGPTDEELMRAADPSRINQNYYEEGGVPQGQMDIWEPPLTDIQQTPVQPSVPDGSSEVRLRRLTRDELAARKKAIGDQREAYGFPRENPPPRAAIRPDRVYDSSPYTYVRNSKGEVEAVPSEDWHGIREDNPDWRAGHTDLGDQVELRQEYANNLWDEYAARYKEDPEAAIKWVQKLDSHDMDIVREISSHNISKRATAAYEATGGQRFQIAESQPKPSFKPEKKPGNVSDILAAGDAEQAQEMHSLREVGPSETFGYSDGGLPPSPDNAYHGESEAWSHDAHAERDLHSVVDREHTARQLAREHGSTVQQARDALAEVDHLMERLGNKDKDVLSVLNSVFRDLNDPNSVPWETITPFYQDARDHFANFMQGLKVAGEVPAMDPKTARALEKFTGRISEALRSVDRNAAKSAASSAWDLASNDYHRYFTNYDNGKTFDLVMRHIFPFWRYETQRFPRLARSLAENPWMLTDYYRFTQETGDGSIRIPGTGIKVNPFGGTMYSTLRGLLRDGGYSFRQGGGVWDRITRLSSDLGFVPGPTLSTPAALKGGSPGDQVPTNIKSAADIARGFGDKIPVVGNSISESAGNVENLFMQSRYRDYSVNQILASKGIHPYEATPEQRDAAEKQASRESAFTQQSGGLANASTRYVADVTQQQAQAALAAGVPEDAVRWQIRNGSNPLYATKDDGTRFLNRAQIRAMEANHPEWNAVAAVRTSFMDPSQQAGEKARWGELKSIDSMQADLEQKLQPAYQAFARGEISGKQLLNLRSTALAQIRGAKESYSKQYPAKANRDTSMLPREDQLAEQYWSIEPATNPDGTPNYDTADMQRQQLLSKANTTQDEIQYITQVWPKQKWQDPLMNSIEGQYQDAAALNKQMYSMPKYPGISQQVAEMGDKGLALAQQVMQGRPNYTLTQALAVVAKADPQLAQAARQVLTFKKKQQKNPNLNPRKQFRNANPILDTFYGN